MKRIQERYFENKKEYENKEKKIVKKTKKSKFKLDFTKTENKVKKELEKFRTGKS